MMFNKKNNSLQKHIWTFFYSFLASPVVSSSPPHVWRAPSRWDIDTILLYESCIGSTYGENILDY